MPLQIQVQEQLEFMFEKRHSENESKLKIANGIKINERRNFVLMPFIGAVSDTF